MGTASCAGMFLQAENGDGCEHQAGDHETADEELQTQESFVPGHTQNMVSSLLAGFVLSGKRAEELLVTYGLHCIFLQMYAVEYIFLDSRYKISLF